MLPITEVARELGLRDEDFEPYGRTMGKVSLRVLDDAPRGAGRLVLVSAISPTPAGEGKTTTSIALGMGMRRIGKRPVVALRQPSLGPIFGIKGGGTGGGRATLEPSDGINVHFTGDIHAIASANNLLSSLVDNAIFWRDRVGGSEVDPRQVTWGRAIDANDRFLRNCVIGLGGKAHGVPREERFDIAAASEVMAIVALSKDRADLEARLGRIIVGSTYDGKPVTATDLVAPAAMTALLRNALLPNLVQTAEGGPAFVHAGPFANIAHGCSSVLATRMAMKLGDYVVTEGGFGFDLGGEKFFDIKCRTAGIFPRAVVLVATLRALAVHGGLDHLDKHLESVAAFGVPVVVALNAFHDDSKDAIASLAREMASRGVGFAAHDGYARGGEGAMELARTVCDVVDATDAAPPPARFLYPLDMPPEEKARAVARTVYGARDVVFTARARADLARYKPLGGDLMPICFAKTHLSLSDDPKLLGRPRDFVVTVREVRLSAGAGLLVALAGDIMTMPGLPREPASRRIRLGDDGRIVGLGG